MDSLQSWLNEMQVKYNPQEKLQSELDDFYMQMAEKYQPKQPKEKSYKDLLLDPKKIEADAARVPYSLASGMYKGFGGLAKTIRGLGSMVADTPVMDIVLSEEHKDKWKKAFDPAIQLTNKLAAQMEPLGFQEEFPRALLGGAGKMAVELPAIIASAGAGLGAGALPLWGAGGGFDEGGWLGAALGGAQGSGFQ